HSMRAHNHGLLLRARFCGLWLQQNFLRSPVIDFRGVNDVGVSTIHLVRGGKLARRFSGSAEFPDDGAVEFHLVDLPRCIHARGGSAVRPGIRYLEILMGSAGYT